MKYADDNKAYAFEARSMRLLEQLRQRLYDDKPMNDVQRRHLANLLDALMHSAVELDT